MTIEKITLKELKKIHVRYQMFINKCEKQSEKPLAFVASRTGESISACYSHGELVLEVSKYENENPRLLLATF